jgi:hypothetical protein
MLLSRDAQRLRPFLLGALFLGSLGHHRPALGYTMTVWGDPYDNWGCVGACGGWDGGGYYDPYYSGDQGGGGGGDASEPGSLENPYNLALAANATCNTQADEREHQAGLAYRVALGGPSRICPGHNEDFHKYYQVVFSDGSVGLYQRADSDCTSTALMIEIRAPACRP